MRSRPCSRYTSRFGATRAVQIAPARGGPPRIGCACASAWALGEEKLVQPARDPCDVDAASRGRSLFPCGVSIADLYFWLAAMMAVMRSSPSAPPTRYRAIWHSFALP